MRELWVAVTALTTACAGGTAPSTTEVVPPRCDPGMSSPEDIRVLDRGDLSPLKNLTCLSGSLILDGTRTPEAVLETLQTIEGDLLVRGTRSLQAVRAPQLRHISGSLVIVDSPRLNTLELPNLAVVGDEVVLGKTAYPPETPRPEIGRSVGSGLTELSLPALTEVGYALTLRGNSQLVRARLPALQRVGGPVEIIEHDRLRSIAFSAQPAFTAGIRLAANAVLPNLDFLIGQRIVGGRVSVVDNARIKDVSGLSALERIQGRLEVHGNDGLAKLELPSLRQTEGLSIVGNISLEGVRLPSLSTIDGRAEIHGHRKLKTISMTAVQGFAGSIDFTNNPALTTITLPATASIEGDLGLVGLPALTRLQAPALETIRDDLVVQSADALVDINLPALTRVGGALTVVDNGKLTSLAGLGKLETVVLQLAVVDNPNLGDCWPKKLAARLQRPPHEGTQAFSNGGPCSKVTTNPR